MKFIIFLIFGINSALQSAKSNSVDSKDRGTLGHKDTPTAGIEYDGDSYGRCCGCDAMRAGDQYEDAYFKPYDADINDNDNGSCGCDAMMDGEDDDSGDNFKPYRGYTTLKDESDAVDDDWGCGCDVMMDGDDTPEDNSTTPKDVIDTDLDDCGSDTVTDDDNGVDVKPYRVSSGKLKDDLDTDDDDNWSCDCDSMMDGDDDNDVDNIKLDDSTTTPKDEIVTIVEDKIEEKKGYFIHKVGNFKEKISKGKDLFVGKVKNVRGKITASPHEARRCKREHDQEEQVNGVRRRCY